MSCGSELTGGKGVELGFRAVGAVSAKAGAPPNDKTTPIQTLRAVPENPSIGGHPSSAA